MQSSLKDLNLNPRSAHNLNTTRNMSPVGYVLALHIFSFSLFFFFLSTSLSLVRSWGKIQQLQEQRYPCLSVCAVFLCVHTMVWLSVCAVFLCVHTMVWLSMCAVFLCVHTMVSLSVFGIFDVHTDVDPCDCAWRLYRPRKRVCTGS